MGWGSLCHALRVPRSSFFFLFSALLAVACDDPEAPSEPVITGVNNVRAACELRSRWTRLDTGDCASCRAAVVLPACGCEGVSAFEALCAPQADARRAHPECTAALDACIVACDPRRLRLPRRLLRGRLRVPPGHRGPRRLRHRGLRAPLRVRARGSAR